jgi:hypothetical protein
LHEVELESGMVLDWYHEYFVQSTKTIDYGITEVRATDKKMTLTIERKGGMPMPIEVEVQYVDGAREVFYIPLDLMRVDKKPESPSIVWNTLADWKWVEQSYVLVLDRAPGTVDAVVIDPQEGMADTDRTNNLVHLNPGEQLIIDKH